MSLTSARFYIFIVVATFLYYIVPQRYRWIMLVLSSICFIVQTNGLKLAMVMGITVILTWCVGILFDKYENKFILFLGILVNISVLVYLKEVNFFIETARILGNWVGIQLSIKNLELVAPLGISYYTLNMISYLLDLYWKIGKVQKNLIKFILFAGYFPIMTSGPIVRYRETEDILYEGHKFNYQNICFGVQRILWGLFKKLVVSERLALIVNTIYTDYNTYAGIYIFIAVICFVFQLYTDFSGCIDIVLGVSELFGIKLPENFETPFFSKNVSEFWRRWHITLGAWLKDYIFYPILKTELWKKIGTWTKKKLGKKLGKKIPVWFGLFFSWFFIGFWHGGSWNYIFGTGIFMWMLIVLGEAFEPLFKWIIEKLKINTECFSWKLFQSLRTFCCIAFGWSFFRAYGGFMEGVKLWKSAISIFNPWILVDGSLLKLGLDGKDMGVLLVSLVVLGVSGIMREYIKRPIREWLVDQNIVFRWSVLYILIFSVLIFGCYGIGYDAQAFIYQGF